MYNAGKIIIGLVIFFVLATLPFFYNMGKAVAKPEPKIDTPEIQKLPESERKCVEPKEFMRSEHMQMLNDWRDSVVRGNTRVYVNAAGKKFDMSLQNTCMRCHSNKKKFCDECHNFMAVKPYCWDCHIAPKEKES
jgi:hypothetical protein